jgi:hypothetical protein
MTPPGQSNTTPPDGILLSASSVATVKDDVEQGWGSFVLAISEGELELRLQDRKDTIWSISLDTFEEALRLLKRWETARRRGAE